MPPGETALAAPETLSAEPTSPLPYGQPAPPLARPSLDHGPIDRAALHNRIVIVHFFATWCEPCREEMAALTRFVERHRDQPVTVLAVDVGEVEVRVRRFFESQPVPFAILLDEDRSATKQWGIEFLPTSYVVDPAGNLGLFVAGPVDWDDPATDSIIQSLTTPATSPAQGELPPSQPMIGSKP
ncbi:TlpA family protein disulfide reductase [Ancylobacter mangrovi]|uniref:TlpA family protein disulfide reductase n=1 Tax=Ancylobacter mangrovi TaxID=2972472 RepID=UPI0021618320|nr:TlpA disulfide reductase family protein [Ancylobacter mangrovi]MCS0504974.1 TlpA family protein disulfide reductase [Ancylobacter mangrovi]